MTSTADLGSVSLAYSDSGGGVPLVCLHGGMGINSRTLHVPGILHLSNHGIRVIIPDQRGHGRSSRSDDSHYTHAVWAEDVRDFAKCLGLSQFALLGHSYGGFLALEYAIRWRQSLTHLILVATSAGPVRVSAANCETDEDLKELFRRQWPHFFVGDDKHWELLEEAEFSSAAFNAAFTRELPKYDLRKHVGQINVPTLLVVGNEDPYRPYMEWFAKNTENSELCVLHGIGHFPFVEAREEFLNKVASFLMGGLAP
jgi:proline iminopeptidase